MKRDAINYVGRYILNNIGWHSNRKIIVIESDDWGSSVMPSLEIYEELLKNGIRVDQNPYTRFDSLASESDLQLLFELLSSFTDKKQNHPVITANTIVANPDYSKIRDNKFQDYFYEPFNKTLLRYPEHRRAFSLMKEGMEQKLFFPQFHGREHLNSKLWVDELRKSDDSYFRIAFNHGIHILPKNNSLDKNKYINSAFYPNNKTEELEMFKSIEEGLSLFKELFGYSSKSFVATGYIWNRNIEKTLNDFGIEYIKGLPIQREPQLGSGRLHKRIIYTGKRNNYKQVYLVRNIFFEPSIQPNKDWIGDCMRRVAEAFRFGKPAIISTHRINYIGYINQTNRNKNLVLFAELLSLLLKKWPEVEFMNAVDLGDLISNS